MMSHVTLNGSGAYGNGSETGSGGEAFLSSDPSPFHVTVVCPLFYEVSPEMFL